MKLLIKPAPSAQNCQTLLVRHTPETETDRKDIRKLEKLLVGMNVLCTFPEIEGEKVASWIFKHSNKRAGSK